MSMYRFLADVAPIRTSYAGKFALAAFVVFYATCATVAGGTPESPNFSRSAP